jgi:glycosyltransferase involved in cell wall biosynthesis
VILAEDGPLVGRLQSAGVSVEVLPMQTGAVSLSRDRVRPGGLPLAPLAFTAAYVARLARRLRRLKPDVVHTNSLKSALYGGAAARLVSRPVVWHLHDRIADDYLPAFACTLVRGAARVLPSAIVANSGTTMRALRGAGPGAVVIPCALGFPPHASPPPDGREPLRVGMVGRLDPWKGQHVFLDAFAKAFAAGSERAVIVGASLFGTDEYARALARQVTALGLDGRVDFRGFRDTIEDELGRLDVLVHASTIAEPFGQVVVEGMAAGLAVIAADAGGPAEVITDGIDGVLYPMGDTDALARALSLLGADAAVRRRLGDRARARAADFTADRIAPDVMAVYRRLVPAVQGGTSAGLP